MAEGALLVQDNAASATPIGGSVIVGGALPAEVPKFVVVGILVIDCSHWHFSY